MQYECNPVKQDTKIEKVDERVIQCTSFLDQDYIYGNSPADDLRDTVLNRDIYDVRELITSILFLEWALFFLGLVISIYKYYKKF